jgi:hypothetical protein
LSNESTSSSRVAPRAALSALLASPSFQEQSEEEAIEPRSTRSGIVSRESRLNDVRAVSLLVAVTIIAAGFRWYYDNWLAGFDMMTYFLPTYEYMGQRLRDFDIPAWNPHQNSGFPSVGDPGAAWLYFPVMIGMFIAKGGTGIKLMVTIQALIAGLATYAFGRKIGFGPAVALFSALAYAIGPPLYDATGQSTVIGQISTFVPVGFLAMEGAFRATHRSARAGWSVLAGLTLCQMFFAWPQGFMYGIMMMAAWIAYRTLIDTDPLRRTARTRIRHAAEVAFVTGLSATLLGAGGILPRLDFSRNSNIPNGDYSEVIGGNYVEWTHTWTEVISNYLTDHLYWRITLQSSVLLLLATFAVCHGRRRFGIPYFLVVALLCVDLSVDPSFTRWAFYILPPFELVHHHRPTATMYMIFFPTVILAGAGLHLLLEQHARGTKPIWKVRRFWLAVAMSGYLLLLVQVSGQGIGFGQPIVWLLAIAVPIVAASRLRSRLRMTTERFILAAMVALLIVFPNGVDLLGTVIDPVNYPEYNDLLGEDDETQAIVNQFQRTSDPGTTAGYLQEAQAGEDPFRYAWYIGIGYEDSYITSSGARMEQGTLGVLANGRSIFLGLEEIAGYNPIHLEDYVELSDAMNGTDQNYHWLETFEYAFTSSQLLDMLNVRYILVGTNVPSDRSDVVAIANEFTEVFRDDQAIVYENPDAYPRAWVVHDIRQDTGTDALEQFGNDTVDGRFTAFVFGEPPSVNIGDGSVLDSAIITKRAPESIELNVTANGDGLLVLSEVYEHNWKAWVDGKEVDILRTNHALRGIPVTSGEHTVVLRYESPYLTLGMWTTGFGSIATIGVWTWAWLDRRRRRERAS